MRMYDLFEYNFVFYLFTFRTFQTFEPAAPGKTLYDPSAQYAGGMYAPPPSTSDNNYFGDGGEATEFDSEPPLLEGYCGLLISYINILIMIFSQIAPELGINPSHIMQKVRNKLHNVFYFYRFFLSITLQTLSVLNPFRTTEQSILQDTDMAGPLVFCLALGGFLLLVSAILLLLKKSKCIL